MKPIDLETWEPNPEDPRYLKYVGQPAAEAVFAELEQWLECTGLMPDEYFLMDREWENGREIPKGADIFCTTDYGASEGIYVDVYLKWYDAGKPVIKSFATGKTLGETGYDLDRMFLTASTITKAFHGEGRSNEPARGVILDLNAEEKKLLSELLAEQVQRKEVSSLRQKLMGAAPVNEQTHVGSGLTMEMSQ